MIYKPIAENEDFYDDGSDYSDELLLPLADRSYDILPELQWMFDNGVDPNAGGDWVPLMPPVAFIDYAVTEFLLEHGATAHYRGYDEGGIPYGCGNYYIDDLDVNALNYSFEPNAKKVIFDQILKIATLFAKYGVTDVHTHCIDIDSEKAIDTLPVNIKQNERSVAEVLAANMRKMIISERPNNPAYFDKMSDLLNQLLQEQKDGKIQYKELIERLIEKLKEARSTTKSKYPLSIDTKGKQALYDNLGCDEELTILVHETIKANARDGFRDMDSSGMKKMRALRRSIESVLKGFEQNKIDDVLQIIIAQKEY